MGGQVYFAVFAVNLVVFSVAGCWSWTSPMIPKFQSTDPHLNPLGRPATTLETSWIASIMNLGAIVGPFIGGYLSHNYGKKTSLLIMTTPILVSHALCAIGDDIYYFLFARLLIGLSAGTIYSVVPGYVGDVSEDKDRGFLGSLIGVFNCLGMLFMFAVGPYLSIKWFSVANMVTPVVFYVVFGVFTPSSPYDLLKEGKVVKAVESLMKLRGTAAEDVQKELKYIRETIEQSGQNVNGLSRILKTRSYVKGLIVSNGLMVFQQLSGICAVLGYLQHIFESSGSSLPATYSAMLVGVIQLMSATVGAQLVSKTGRKALIMVSNVFGMLGLIALGVFFYLKDDLSVDVSALGYLPISSLVIYILVLNVGLSIQPWAMLAELFPPDIKAISATISTFTSFSLSFITTLGFPFMADSIGLACTFWVFAAILFLGSIFTFLVVPETGGKSIEEVQHVLARS
ncbi:facilitated trehalose transporter Tret1-like [Anthonomus grandis grandis]|uniref:facilitated trehalose transporter Tret1-like n=1 Tax=Anthonomus grandis grandis TaxID=2921223 RepID=UPI002165BB5B|nr:facilitated trehalose transporter Tret1-like [Anthonomus grandis grandis]